MDVYDPFYYMCIFNKTDSKVFSLIICYSPILHIFILGTIQTNPMTLKELRIKYTHKRFFNSLDMFKGLIVTIKWEH